jgi:hypothetical protein
MTIEIVENCIARKDGTYICIDRAANKLLRFTKPDIIDEITTADVSKEELLELAILMGKPKQNVHTP